MTEGHNGQLQSIIERIERLEDEKAKISLDIKEIYAEAKANGFDAKILRKIVAIRKQDADKRDEEQQLIATYMAALGMLADTPLGQAAIARNVRT
jgi:uncharacterized protein (UPF0335 family)